MLQYLAKKLISQRKQNEDKDIKSANYKKCKPITQKLVDFHILLKSIVSKQPRNNKFEQTFQVQIFDSESTDTKFNDELETLYSIANKSLNSYLDDSLCSIDIEQQQNPIDLKQANSPLEHLTDIPLKQSFEDHHERLNIEQFGDVMNNASKINNDSKCELLDNGQEFCSNISAINHKSQDECGTKTGDKPQSELEDEKEANNLLVDLNRQLYNSEKKTIELLNNKSSTEKHNDPRSTVFDRLDSPLSDFTDYYYHYNFYEQITKVEQKQGTEHHQQQRQQKMKKDDLEVKIVQNSILSRSDELKQKAYYKSQGDLLLVRKNIHLQHGLVKKTDQSSASKVFNRKLKNNLRQNHQQIIFQEFNSTIIWISPIKKRSIILLRNKFLPSSFNYSRIDANSRFKQSNNQFLKIQSQLNKTPVDTVEYKIQLKTHEQHAVLAIDFNAFNNAGCNPFEGYYRSLSHSDYSRSPSHWSDVYFDFNVGKENKLHMKIRNDIPLKYCATVIAYQLGNPMAEKKIHFYWPNDTTELNINQSLNEMNLENNVEIITKFQP
ncbi:unnamed protein product [Trichobilharzia regenti]|uniref:Endo/exonuclease/phosphatase domain-containing protein n=1 Tax=Trichobilharzia regenti TaxID=157069 RepID=A0A183VNI4_TRIRE|nr:unnamed protein product [Trichobilharzia regenti]VDP97919.1 unnamed protein product [Trichobilharzia regenti]